MNDTIKIQADDIARVIKASRPEFIGKQVQVCSMRGDMAWVRVIDTGATFEADSDSLERSDPAFTIGDIKVGRLDIEDHKHEVTAGGAVVALIHRRLKSNVRSRGYSGRMSAGNYVGEYDDKVAGAWGSRNRSSEYSTLRGAKAWVVARLNERAAIATVSMR